MRKPIIVLSLLFAFAIVSGCISQDSKTTPRPPISDAKIYDLIPKEGPPGFRYLGTHDVVFLENVTGLEGIYQDSYGTDLYIQVVNMSNMVEAEELIRKYKSQDFLKNLSYNPFKEVYNISGHKATQITTYYTKDGRNAPHYIYIWNNESFVFLVTGNTETQEPILRLARAVGY